LKTAAPLLPHHSPPIGYFTTSLAGGNHAIAARRFLITWENPEPTVPQHPPPPAARAFFSLMMKPFREDC